MLNLFGAIANGLGRMLPGYLNGYRMAVQDNWNDLNNYNKVQQGQINNAWLETSFNPMYNQLWYDTAMKQMAALGMRMNLGQQEAAYPGALAATWQNSAMAPMMNAMKQQNTMEQYAHNSNMRAMEQAAIPSVMDMYNATMSKWLAPQENVTLPSSTNSGLSGNPEEIARGGNGSFFTR